MLGSNSIFSIEVNDHLNFTLRKAYGKPYEIHLEKLVNQLVEAKGNTTGELINPELMMKLDSTITNLKVRIFFTQINYNVGGEEIMGMSAFQGYILLKEF